MPTPATAARQQIRDVVFVDGVRTPFGKAGEKGIHAGNRADDLVVKGIRELLRRNPSLPPERIDDVAIAATTQSGDQGLTIGRTGALLSGLPRTVPGFAIDRMCAGAMTAVTTTASGIAFGAYDVVVAGGVEHMGNHPMGSGAIAVGHPLASSGVRLMTQLARQFEEDPQIRYGITTMCVGLGMGGTVIWENPHHADYSRTTTEDAA